jgi:predicted PurR-regulated permease PerM
MMPSVNKLPKWLVLGLGFPVIVINGWLLLVLLQYLQPLISVVVSAILFSFVLDYPVKFLQQKGVERHYAVWWVFLVTFLLVLAIGLTLVPVIIEQLNEFANRLPVWIESGIQQMKILNNWVITRNFPLDFSGLVKQITERFSDQIQLVTAKIITLAFDTIGSVFNVFLTAVLTFYLVSHGERLWDGIFQWFPSKTASLVRQSLYQNFHNYFIGQATIAAFLGLALILAFWILKVPLGLLFGFTIGVMGLFPLGAGIGITFVSFLITLQDFWLGLKVLAVGVAIDQINANVIAPRVLGGFTGLNPVWILLSLLLGAKIGGVLGLLIAVPMASFIKSMAENWRAGTWR